jgi:hypothetical protein
MRVLSKLICLSAILLHTSVWAAKKLEISGFGTLGLVTTDSDDDRFRTDMSQDSGARKGQYRFDMLSKVGVQFDYHINYEWDAVAQFVYRQQDRQNLDSSTSLAFVRYRPNANWQLRAGRVYPNIFEQSEVRDVGIAYMWTKVPTEVYGPIPARNLDGAEVFYLNHFDNFSLQASIFGGQMTADFNSGAHLPIDFNNLFGTSVRLESFEWTLNARYIQTEFGRLISPYDELVAGINSAAPLWPNAPNFANDFNFSGKKIQYMSLFGMYQFENWQLSGELTAYDSDTTIINSTSSGYINIAVPRNKNTFYFTFSTISSVGYDFNETIYQPQVLAELLFYINEAHAVFDLNQSSYSIGWRHDLSSNVALKFQLEHTKIDDMSGGLRLQDSFRSETKANDVNTLFVTLDFSF